MRHNARPRDRSDCCRGTSIQGGQVHGPECGFWAAQFSAIANLSFGCFFVHSLDGGGHTRDRVVAYAQRTQITPDHVSRGAQDKHLMWSCGELTRDAAGHCPRRRRRRLVSCGSRKRLHFRFYLADWYLCLLGNNILHSKLPRIVNVNQVNGYVPSYNIILTHHRKREMLKYAKKRTC